MKLFNTIFNYELMNYLKNKTFVYTTIALVSIAFIAGFFPLIVSYFITPTTDNIKPISAPIAIYDTSGNLSKNILDFSLGNGNWIPLQDNNENTITAAISQVSNGNLSAILISDGLTYTIHMMGTSGTSFDFETIKKMVANANIASVLNENFSVDSQNLLPLLTTLPEANLLFIGVDGSLQNVDPNSPLDIALAGQSSISSFVIGYGLLILLYVSIIMFGSLIMHAVVTEKSTKVMELLLISVKPTYLIFGKVFAAAVSGISQLILILVAFLPGIVTTYRTSANIPDEIFAILNDLSGTGPIIAYAFVYFILGFFTFSFLFAAFASLASSLDDLKSLSIYPTLLFLPGFFVAITAFNNPHAFFIPFLSLIPFLSPLVMFSRISMTTVPFEQILFSIAINLATIFLTGMFSSKLYRAGVLMYGNKPTFLNIISAMRKS